MLKDKRAALFFFFMNLILLDFGNQIRLLSFHKEIMNFENALFSIYHAKNLGSAFSLFENIENSAYILSLLGVFAVVVIFYLVIKNVSFEDKFLLLSLTLFSSGTLGNALERFSNGYVTDYIKLNFINFPVFNAYDIMITIGCVLYIAFVLFQKDSKIEENENKN